MRKNLTDAEMVMWDILRKYRHSGFLFRRQHPSEFYITDFYCYKLKLVIEVDGGIHSREDIHFHDEGRTGEMERFGIKVYRFTNSQVLNDTNFVKENISEIIQSLSLS